MATQTEGGHLAEFRRDLAETEHTKEQQVEGWIADAVAARQDYDDAGRMFALLTTHEAELEAKRPFIKQEAVLRLMTEGKLAATNAEKLSVLDEEYLRHLTLQRAAVAAKNDACTRMHSARLRAELAIAAIRSLAGLI